MTLTHRGPDEEGYFINDKAFVGLGHQRLSIIDLATGQQPLSSEDGSVWISFNGEIYNFQDLIQELEAKGHQLRTKSDTEAIVHAWEEWGPDAVKKLKGMFAFAIWDENKQQLFLARDRLGKKTLYYLDEPKRFVFGSEIKAILLKGAASRQYLQTPMLEGVNGVGSQLILSCTRSRSLVKGSPNGTLAALEHP